MVPTMLSNTKPLESVPRPSLTVLVVTSVVLRCAPWRRSEAPFPQLPTPGRGLWCELAQPRCREGRQGGQNVLAMVQQPAHPCLCFNAFPKTPFPIKP